jgi:hypothetical protein
VDVKTKTHLKQTEVNLYKRKAEGRSMKVHVVDENQAADYEVIRVTKN